MRTIIILFLLLSTTIQAQGKKYEKIKALKTAYITDQLEFTPTEAEKFWPVYNGFESQLYDLRYKKNKGIYNYPGGKIENLTEVEASKIMDEYLTIETNILELQKQRINALKRIISPKQIFRLLETEDNFKHELLKRYRQRKDQLPHGERKRSNRP